MTGAFELPEQAFRLGIVAYLQWWERRRRLREYAQTLEDCDFRRQAFELLDAERQAAPMN